MHEKRTSLSTQPVVSKRTILVVDDALMDRAILCNILKKSFHVLQAKNGIEALDILLDKSNDVSVVFLDLIMPNMDGYKVIERMHASKELSQIPIIVTTSAAEDDVKDVVFSMGVSGFISKPYKPESIHRHLWNAINHKDSAGANKLPRYDELTNLFNRNYFIEQASAAIADHEASHYIMASIDINSFKIINDQNGTQAGDQVLKHVANCLIHCFSEADGLFCRVASDNFAALFLQKPEWLENCKQFLQEASRPRCLDRPISIRIGYYIVDNLSMSASSVYDRARLAEASIKGNLDKHIASFDESMRENLLLEQEIISEMESALKSGQFEIWFQPQYNHATGARIGAEALVRWRHPIRGLIGPKYFVPFLERSGLITTLDRYVWEQTCNYLRKWSDAGYNPLPVSVNVSRYDLLRDEIVETLACLPSKYGIPQEMLRLEVTESAFADDSARIIDTVEQLIDNGFTVEIDDFGSGYSSLNTLKDVPAHILKLDMRFLESSRDTQRGGSILSSIVRMAKWLGMPVIAEGVETRTQADFLKSIGCFYIQGYLYAQPMPAQEYEMIVAKETYKEVEMVVLETVENLNNNSFWDPDSMDTLIFNSYVGGACIFEYHDGSIELLRATDKYAQVIGSSGMTIEDALKLDWAEHLDEKNANLVLEAINRSLQTGDEVTSEYMFHDLPDCPKETYLRSTLRVIARAGDRCLVYCTNENITALHEAQEKEHEASEQIRAIMDNMQSGVSAITINEDGSVNFAFVNNNYFSILGYTREQYESEVSDTFAIVHPQDVDRIRSCVNKVFASGHPATYEYRVIRRDSSIGFIQCSASLTNIERFGGNVLLSVMDDVTEYVATREKSNELSAQVEDLMNDTPGGFARIAIYPNKKVVTVYVNDMYCSFRGIPRAQILSMPPHDSVVDVHPEDAETVRREFKKTLADGSTRTVMYRLRCGDGNYKWFRVFARASSITTSESFLNLYYTDLEEHDKINQQRRELLDNMPCGAGLYEWDGKKHTTVHINRRYQEMIGQNIDADPNSAIFETVHPDDLPSIRKLFNASLSGENTGDCDVRIMHADGHYRVFHVECRAITHENGTCTSYVTFLPVPKGKMNLQHMLPLLLDAIMKSSSDLSFAKDKNFNYLCCSRGFAKLVGLANAKDIVGKTDFDLFDKETADKYRNDDIRLFEEGNSLIDMIERIPSDDGIPHFSSTSKYLLRDENDDIIGLYGTGRDITENREAYSQLKLLTESISGGLATYVIDTQGIRLNFFNEGFCNLFGYTQREYAQISKKTSLGLIFEDDLPALMKKIETMLKNNCSIEHTYRVHHKDGGYRWIALNATPTDCVGNTVVAQAVLLDITERKELSESISIDALPYDYATYELSSSGIRLTRYIEKEEKLSGYSHKEYMERATQDPLFLVYKDDRDVILENARIISKEFRRIDCTYRITTKDGSCRWINAKAEPKERRGDKVIVSVLKNDISDIMRAEEALRQSEQILRMVVRHSNRIIYRYDIDTREAFSIEPKATLEAGFPTYVAKMPESLIEQGVLLLEDSAHIHALFTQARKRTRDDSLRVRARKTTGEIAWLDVNYTFVRDENGSPEAAVISCADITKQYESELAFTRYQQTIEESTQDGTLFFETDITSDHIEKLGGVLFEQIKDAVSSTRSETISNLFENFVIEEDRPKARQLLSREHIFTLHASGEHALNCDLRAVFHDGSLHYMHCSLEMLMDPYTNHLRVFTRITDITDKKLAELDMQRLAEKDGMTDLYNKTATEALIKEHFVNDNSSQCALLLIDLDNLKIINDILGHDQGDRAIQLIGKALKSQFRHSDIIGRVGGDEFLIFLDDYNSESWLKNMLDAILAKLSTLHVGENNDYQLRSSIGVTTSSKKDVTFETLFKQADRALYHVKRNGKNGYAFYAPEMEEEFFSYRSHLAKKIEQGILTLTTREATAMIRELRLVFETVRLVDVTISDPSAPNEIYFDEQNQEPCYAIWGRTERCENCIARRAFKEKSRFTKSLTFNNEQYTIISSYIEVDGVACVLEAIAKVTERTDSL